MMRLFRCLFLLSFVAPAFALLTRGDVTLETGEIAGAKFTIARPASWSGNVLLLAHGLRDANRPLSADLYPEHQAYKTLLNEGWIVARTSYRRNGIIVADAINDLDNLRAYIAKKDGEPKRVLLEGESMGGLIVTLIAEREPKLYAGAVAIGAALKIPENGTVVPATGHPNIPLLFLTNQSELDGPVAYVKAASSLGENAPALFRVSRDGHVNVNQAERIVALRALNAWIDLKRGILPHAPADQAWFDATVHPRPLPSQVALLADHRGFTARVTDVSINYGNVVLSAQSADFAAIHLTPGTWFEIEAHGRTFPVFYGRDFSSVKKGEWLIFANADGFFWLARNFADAAASAELKQGDIVIVRHAAK